MATYLYTAVTESGNTYELVHESDVLPVASLYHPDIWSTNVLKPELEKRAILTFGEMEKRARKIRFNEKFAKVPLGELLESRKAIGSQIIHVPWDLFQYAKKDMIALDMWDNQFWSTIKWSSPIVDIKKD